MQPSEALKAFTKRSEGKRTTAYWDVNGYSIGYGHHESGSKSGETWTDAQIDAAFEGDMEACAAVVNGRVKVPLTQGQFDCLCDFVFNEGSGKFTTSTLLAVINSGQLAKVPDLLYHENEDGSQHGWVFSNGKINEGLVGRRKGEIEFWNGEHS